MESNVKNTSFRLLMLIATKKIVKIAEEVFGRENLTFQYRFHAEGTASSEIIDMLGLGNIDKYVLVSMMPRQIAGKMLKQLHKECSLSTAGSGIAFTVPLNGANNRFLSQIAKNNVESAKENEDMTEIKNVLITAIVNRGFSAKVMESARGAGARGGTVIHSRQISNEEAAGYFGNNVQEEKDIVLILSDVEDKVEIMRAVNESCGINSEAQGIVVSMPIDTVMGI
ncbi:MAG: hypothetical protein E7672_09850 [Ruminococcaceae bacterium]|nr:hypothetical protein [Oscillospiraceae bacterium]